MIDEIRKEELPENNQPDQSYKPNQHYQQDAQERDYE